MQALCLPGEDPHSFMGSQIAGVDYGELVRAVHSGDKKAEDRRQLGKVANLPLYKLWGGARDRLPIIAIGGQYHDDYKAADYGREMEEFLELANCVTNRRRARAGAVATPAGRSASISAHRSSRGVIFGALSSKALNRPRQ